MGDITAVCTFERQIGPQRVKKLYVSAPATADDGDTFTVTMTQYGFATFWGVNGYAHTTANSVVVGEAPTTSVTAGVLTVTVGGSTDNLVRFYELMFK